MAAREIHFYKHYFHDFFQTLDDKTKKKVLQVLVWIETIERLPIRVLRNIESYKGLYEIRIEFGGNVYRIFCCFDKGKLIILLNGFQKKTQKTPSNEFEKAARLMKEYFESKQ